MEQSAARDVTSLLLAWRGGDEQALAELMPLVYRRLREIAGHLMRRERQDHTLETSALVHEAYVRLVDLRSVGWRDRAHFYAMCARIMRRVLVDHARAAGRDKRGGGALRVETTDFERARHVPEPDLVALHDALGELAEHDPEMARVVELRFFGGLDREEIAEVLGTSSATVTRRWRAARAWLIRYLG